MNTGRCPSTEIILILYNSLQALRHIDSPQIYRSVRFWKWLNFAVCIPGWLCWEFQRIILWNIPIFNRKDIFKCSIFQPAMLVDPEMSVVSGCFRQVLVALSCFFLKLRPKRCFPSPLEDWKVTRKVWFFSLCPEPKMNAGSGGFSVARRGGSIPKYNDNSTS